MKSIRENFMKTKFLKLYSAGIFSMLITILLPMVDSIVGGQVIGENALTAINIVIPAYNVACFLGGLICFGIPVLYSNAIGSFDKKGANQIYSLGFVSSIAVGIIYFLVLVIFGELYINSYNSPAEIISLVRPYFFWYKLNILITPFYLFMNEMVMADGNEKLGTVSAITQFLVNLVLSFLFSHFLGIGGIGLASFLGTLSSTLVLLLHFFSKGCSLKFVRYFSFKKLCKIASFSMVDSLTYLYAALFVTFINRFIIANLGEEYLPIVSIYSFMFECMIMFNGVASALNPMVAIYDSEGNVRAVDTLMKFASRVAASFGVIVTVLLLVFAPLIPRVLGINSEELIEPSNFAVRSIALFFVFVSLHYEYSSYYNVQEKFITAIIMCALRDLILPVGMGFALGLNFGLTGLSIGIGCSIVITNLLVMLCIKIINRKMTYPRLFLNDDGRYDDYVYSFKTSPQEIMDTVSKAREELERHSVSAEIKNKVCLIIEESFMLIRERNGNKDILAECTLMIGDQIELIFRDMGIIFNLTDADSSISSFRQYIVNNIMDLYNDRNYLLTNSYNRSRFILK